MNWVITIVFIVLVFLLGSWYLKAEHNVKKVKIIFIVILLVIFYLSIVRVFSSDKVDLSSPKGIVNGIYIYFGWVGESLSNLWHIGSDTTGKVVQAVHVNNTKTDTQK